MKLFLQKNAKFSSAGAPPPDPHAYGSWGLCPQTPIGLRRLGALPPDPPNKPPRLRISGYAPGSECKAPSHWVFFCNFLKKSYFDAIGSHFAHVQSNLKELDI